jgi:hypothetical protein
MGYAPGDYADAFLNPRFARGEVLFLGRTYAALAVGQELTPLVSASGAVIANLADPSALIAPSVAWSVADDAAVSVGGYVPVGKEPPERAGSGEPAALPELPSEFGLYPTALFLSMRAYF